MLLATAGVLALFGGAPQARAYTISIGGVVASDGSGLTTAVGSTMVLTFDSLPPLASGHFIYGGVGFDGDGEVIVGSSSSKYSAPAGDTTNFLVAGGPSSSYIGDEDLTIFGPSSNYFGLYWGSMDRYNTLIFLNGGSPVARISGTDVAAGGNANGDRAALGTNNYVNIFGLSSYDTVVFSTSAPNFEVDNIAFGRVPAPDTRTVAEPGTLALFGAGLLGLGLIRRKRRS